MLWWSETKEELEQGIETLKKEMPEFVEGIELCEKMLRDLPQHEAVKKQQFELFHKLCPNRCGQIDFEKNTVKYDEEHYTEWHTNFTIEHIEDYIRVFDYVGLDYEVRIADLYDISRAFSVYFANTDSDEQKYWVALKMERLYASYYGDLLEKLGICRYDLTYSMPWTGCEREIDPIRFANNKSLIPDSEVDDLMKKFYEQAYNEGSNPQIMDLSFNTDPVTKRRHCSARLDKEQFELARKYGFSAGNLNIQPEKFQHEYVVKQEKGRDIYYIEFDM